MSVLRVVVALSISVLMVFPVSIPRVHSLVPVFALDWSAFGPRVDNLDYNVCSYFTECLSDFQAGKIDIADFPVPPAAIQSFSINPDFFVTPKEPSLNIFELDINHANSFLGVPLQVSRTSSVPSCLITITAACPSPPIAPGTPSLTITSISSCGTCPSGDFLVIVHLKNIEEGRVAGTSTTGIIADPNNQVTATISGVSPPTPLVQKSDDGDPNPTGTYSFFLASAVGLKYIISTTIYSGSPVLFASGTTQPACTAGQTCVADLLVDYNSPSTMKPTVAGIEIGRALSHLVDKPAFLGDPNLSTGGVTLADCDDVQASPAQNLMSIIGAGACNHASSSSAATISADCAEHTWLTSCSPVSLYNLTPDRIGGASSCATNSLGSQIPTATCFPSQASTVPPVGYSGFIDLRASCDHLSQAGFALVPATATCADVASGNVVNGVTAHLSNNGLHLTFYIRSHPPRRDFGTIIADELNFLFGTPAPSGGTICYMSPVTSCVTIPPIQYSSIVTVAPIIFSSSGILQWNLYTGGFGLGSTPVQLYSFYHSAFATTQCGGIANGFPNNYVYFCDPTFDTQAYAGNFGSTDLAAFQNAATLGATRGMTVPIYSDQAQYAALNAWNYQRVGIGAGSSLVPVFGHGFAAGSGFLLNMRPVPGYVPSSSSYYASGCNPTTGCQQNLIRRSLSEPTLHLSPFTFLTDVEKELFPQIYDSLLLVNPNTAGSNQQAIDWMTTSYSSSFDVTTQRTTQTWNLRDDLFFTDGVPVTAHDVCFSLLSYRDAPSASLSSSVADLASCRAAGDKVTQVILNGQSAFGEQKIGTLPIIPEHVWANVPGTGGLVSGTDQVVTPSALANPNFDPIAAGIMVGSGPWVCDYSSGVSTILGQASCTQNSPPNCPQGMLLCPAGQSLTSGSRIVLKRNLAYMRCCDNVQSPTNGLPTTNLQALEWADADKDGKITLVDVLGATSHFGSYDPYFASPIYSTSPANHVVDLGDISVIAFYFDDGLTAPFLGTPTSPFTSFPPPLTNIDPSTDPYRLDLGNGNAAYYLSTTFSPSGATITLATIAGTVVPSSFTATEGGVTVTGTPGMPGQVLLTFSGLPASHYTFVISYAGAFVNPLLTISV